MSDLAKTGIPELDSMLGGGLPPKCVVLLRGGPGTGKTTLALQIVSNILKGRADDRFGFFYSLESKDEDVLNQMAKTYGIRFNNGADGPFASCKGSDLDEVLKVENRPLWKRFMDGLRHLLSLRLPVKPSPGERFVDCMLNHQMPASIPPADINDRQSIVVVDSLNNLAGMLASIGQDATPLLRRLVGSRVPDMRMIIQDLSRSTQNRLGRKNIIIYLGEYDESKPEVQSLFGESFFCDVEIVLVKEKVSLKDIEPGKRPAVGEKRFFCHVVKARGNPSQTRRCLYDFVPKVGLKFYETYPGDGRLLLYQENAPTREEWEVFLKRDIPDMYPTLGYELFDRSGLQRTFASQRRLGNVPERMDMYLSSFDTYWVNWLVELAQRRDIRDLINDGGMDSGLPCRGNSPGDEELKGHPERFPQVVGELHAGWVDSLHKLAGWVAKLEDALKANPELPISAASNESISAPSFAPHEFRRAFTEARLMTAITTAGIPVPGFAPGIDALNKLLTDRNLYANPYFAGLRLPPEAVALQARAASLSTRETMRLNRLVLETAFPKECPMTIAFPDVLGKLPMANLPGACKNVSKDHPLEVDVPELLTAIQWDDTYLRNMTNDMITKACDGCSHKNECVNRLPGIIETVLKKKDSTGMLSPIPADALRLFGERRSYVVEELKKRSPDDARPIYREYSIRYANKMLAVPYNANVSFLVVNKATFDEVKRQFGQDKEARKPDLEKAIRKAYRSTQGLKPDDPLTDPITEAIARRADALAADNVYPETWEEVLALSASLKKQADGSNPFLIETRTFDTYLATFLEVLWSTGEDLIVHPNYRVEGLPPGLAAGGTSIVEALLWSFRFFRQLFAEKITPPNCSLENEPLEKLLRSCATPPGEEPQEQKGWLFARYWYSTIIDTLTWRHENETGKPINGYVFGPELFAKQIEIISIPLSLNEYARQQAAAGKSNDFKPEHHACWGEWYFGILKGSENLALGIDLINNLMSAQKITERAFQCAAVPTVQEFYNMYGGARCMNLPDSDVKQPEKNWEQFKEDFFTGTKSRTAIFDYRHCMREIHAVLEWIRTAALETGANPTPFVPSDNAIRNRIIAALRNIEGLRNKPVLLEYDTTVAQEE